MAKKIVLADDEQFIAIAYNDGLVRAGYTVFVAHDGDEALKLVKAEKPDIVLLDLIMPKKDGFTVLREMKSDPDMAKTPVLILSNLSQATDAQEARSLGANDFLVKSDVSLQELIERISKLLSA